MSTLPAPSKVKTDLAFAAKRKPEYQAKVRNSLHIIRLFLGMHPNAIVSVSGGKDSTVLAHLVYRVKRVPLVWSDDEFYLPETGEYMERLGQAADLHHIRTNASHAPFFKITGQKWDSINHYAATELNSDAIFIGSRKDESGTRRRRAAIHGPMSFTTGDYKVKEHKFYACHPLYDWTAADVWAYIISNDVDYNCAYDLMDEHGIDLEQQRVGPYAPAGAYKLALTMLSQVWPDESERFAVRYPEARQYV